MSDYMFMLENHLTSQQSRVVSDMSTAASQAGVNLFLTGGAVRDMLGGFAVRDLDFTVEGNAMKLGKAVAHSGGGQIVSADDNRKSLELLFPGGVTAEVAMARSERYAKPGGKPHVTAADIHEDLAGRDFTINAVALSLARASRGLLLDPSNGRSDLESRELRTVTNHALADDPVRMLRLIRFKVRLGMQVAERTQIQFENAREANLQRHISPKALLNELRHMAKEANSGDIVQALEQEKLLPIISPQLTGASLNLAAFAKLQKARQLLPFGVDLHLDDSALFFSLLTERLSPKERTALAQSLGMEKAEVDAWQKLDSRARKVETEVASAGLHRPSRIYELMRKTPGDQMLYLLVKSPQRLVQDRIRNYLSKYLPMALEVMDDEVAAPQGVLPDSPKFAKLKGAAIAKKLDSRPKKPVEPEVEVPVIATTGRK